MEGLVEGPEDGQTVGFVDGTGVLGELLGIVVGQTLGS